MEKKWNARTSSLGGYAACSFRAWLDHGLATGRLDPKQWGVRRDQDGSNPPADYGTCCHWTIQSSLRACFKPDKKWNDFTHTGWDEPEALRQKYRPEVWASGCSLHRDEATATAIMHRMAVDCRRLLPRPDARGWVAEACFDVPGLLNGHIDLITDDWEDIVDIKTTGSKPPKGRIKASHVWQLYGYALGTLRATGTMPKRAWILYLHSRGEWSFRSKPVEFQPHMLAMLTNRLRIYADWYELSRTAAPSFGAACEDFCPYTRVCRDSIIPPGVPVQDRAIDMPAGTNPF